MGRFITIAERLYHQIVDTIFGAIPDNAWYTTHLDAIRGITTVILVGVVLCVCVGVVVAVMRFLGGLLGWRR